MPLLRRQPKLGGFTHPRRVHYEILNLDILEEKLPAGTYDVSALRRALVARTQRPLKILAGTTLTKKFDLSVNAASKGAKAAVLKAGGSLQIVKL